jgi:nicotinate-nucleotide adenylyltransferase
MKRKKIGIIGGSFNPVHNGHLVIAEWFKQEIGLDLVIFIPAYVSPFKVDERLSNSVTDIDRYNMLKLAIEDNKSFICDDFEINRKVISYSIETVKHLKRKYINSDLFLLIGEDQAVRFNQWFKWLEILGICRLCIACREFDSQQIQLINQLFSAVNYSPQWISSPKIEISSTDIRQRVKSQKSIKYLTADKVVNYIYSNELYK